MTVALPVTNTPVVAVRPDYLPRIIVPGFYLHVPFCFHKCHYCDFYSITRQTIGRMRQFVDRVLAEADLWAKPRGPVLQPRTVFFGGGTPSLLPLDEMSRLIHGLRDRFSFNDLQEWTVEVNPATASLEYCQMLRSAGIDRISLGAQSFDRGELGRLERHHDPDDVPRSIELARKAGFDRLNIDLIYAIPGQTMDSWACSLDEAIALNLAHYSCYGLTYEPNTPIAVRKRLGYLVPASDDLELEMMHEARRRLAKAGCPAYEISNYATLGQECRHNLLYWTGGSYIGLGPSAASHVEGHRFRNRPHLGEWEQAIDRGELPAMDIEVLSPPHRARELVMLELRLTDGVRFEDFTRRSGFDAQSMFARQIERLAKVGLLEVDAAAFRLTRSGLNVADAVAAEFLKDDDSPTVER